MNENNTIKLLKASFLYNYFFSDCLFAQMVGLRLREVFLLKNLSKKKEKEKRK